MDLLSNLRKVHRETLKRFTYVPDRVQYKVSEHWPQPKQLPDFGPFRGDCDDFALMCRKQLHKLGIKNRLVCCIVETGGGHLVCEVEGYILDNRCSDVARRDDLPYTWYSISGYNTGDQWHTIK